MKNFKFIPLISACLFLTFSSCTPETKDPVIIESTIYESCCGTEPVEFKNGGIYVFVPNVFTPNNDGINDYFAPYVDENVAEVVNYFILSEKGDTVIFSRPTIDFKDITGSAWDGFRPNGKPYIGSFNYSMEVVTKGFALVKITGKACRIQCGPEAAVFKGRKGCFFPIQIDGNGKLDPLLPNAEQECFK